jgi:hypothetical protein
MGAQSITWAELLETIGPEAAQALGERYGGVSKYIPSDYTRGDLLPLLGIYAATAMSARYGGSTLMIPNAVKKRKPVKARILQLIAAGWSTRRVALECQVTERWVDMVCREASRRQTVRTLPIRRP